MGVTRYSRPREELDLPEPELTPGHALLEVLACGVCFSDVKTSRGHMPYSDELALPHVPGHEICGRVLATDPPGDVEPGTRVVVHHYFPCGRCARCRAGEENLCTELRAWIGFTHQGGFAERVVVPLDRLLPIPDSVETLRAGPMTCALGTAYRAVVGRGEVAAGMRVALIGLGGVGMHAAQIARHAGAEVVGIDRAERTLAVARELGIDAREADDPSIESAAPDGFDLGELELVGSRYVARDELERAIRLVAQGHVQIVVDEVRPLAEVNDVFA